MTKEEVMEWARQNGWTQDPHHPNVFRKKGRRLKFQATSVRYEKSYDSLVDESKKWVNLKSNYYARLTMGQNDLKGQLIGLGAVGLW